MSPMTLALDETVGSVILILFWFIVLSLDQVLCILCRLTSTLKPCVCCVKFVIKNFCVFLVGVLPTALEISSITSYLSKT